MVEAVQGDNRGTSKADVVLQCNPEHQQQIVSLSSVRGIRESESEGEYCRA